MAEEFKDLYASDPDGINDDQLLRYLKGELSPEELREVELAMVDSEMLSDAAEGLQPMDDHARLESIQQKINANLRKQLQKRDAKKERRKMIALPWTVVFIVVILLLLLISFGVIYFGR